MQAWKFIEIDMKANEFAAVEARDAIPDGTHSCVAGNTLTWVTDPGGVNPNAGFAFPAAPQHPLRTVWKIYKTGFDAAFEGNI